MTAGLSERMIEKLKLESDFFNLRGLRYQILVAYPHPDDHIVIDARGMKIKSIRRIIAKGQYNGDRCSKEFSSLFDPQSSKFVNPEEDGTYKIDLGPGFVECLLAQCECDSVESKQRVWREFHDKYGVDMMNQWGNEFINKYW